MLGDNQEDILSKEISLSSKARILIIGGGRAGFIKLRSFAEKEFTVHVLSKDFSEEIMSFSEERANVELLNREYSEDVLDGYEVVVVGTDNYDLNEKIAESCRKKRKIFLYLPDFKAGNLSLPVEVETEQIKLSIGTKCGSPRTAMFLAERMAEAMKEYDGFVDYICRVRSRIEDSSFKREIMEFMNTEEFYEIYRAGNAEYKLRAIYGGEVFETENCD